MPRRHAFYQGGGKIVDISKKKSPTVGGEKKKFIAGETTTIVKGSRDDTKKRRRRGDPGGGGNRTGEKVFGRKPRRGERLRRALHKEGTTSKGGKVMKWEVMLKKGKTRAKEKKGGGL